MKVSEMTLDDIKDYIRIDSEDDDLFLNTVFIGAKSFIRSYTGLTDEQIDEKEELTLPIYVLCAEMYDNRQLTIDKCTLNPIIKSILSMHCVNLL